MTVGNIHINLVKFGFRVMRADSQTDKLITIIRTPFEHGITTRMALLREGALKIRKVTMQHDTLNNTFKC